MVKLYRFKVWFEDSNTGTLTPDNQVKSYKFESAEEALTAALDLLERKRQPSVVNQMPTVGKVEIATPDGREYSLRRYHKLK